MKKLILTTIALITSTGSLSVFAQNIDTGYETKPFTYFTATGLDENGSHEFAESDMRSNANRACGYGPGAEQTTPTRYRNVYTYLHASAEFRCFNVYRETPRNDPGPHGRCWYIDDSNPHCLKENLQAVLEI